jgi:hypothetical protein
MTAEGQDNSAREEMPRKGQKKVRKDPEDEEAPRKDEYQLEIEAELKELERCRPRALEVLERGDPLRYLLDTFNQIHVGDRDAAEVQFIAFGCQASLNCRGIQANWTGPSGKGKSAGAEACYHLLPRMFVLKGSVSAKSLFYHKDLPDGACIFLDDMLVEEGTDLEATIKRSTSAFQEGAYHETLDGNRQLLRMRLPKRLCWTLTYVDVIESGDQFLNRMFVVKTDSSRQADEDVCRHILCQAECGAPALPLNDGVLVCKAMMLDIKNRPPYRVLIPELPQRVSFTDRRNRRNPSLFVDLVIGLACIRHRQRKREQAKGGEWCLFANMDDIREAARIFNAQGDYLGSRLDDAERAAALFIFESGEAGLSIKGLAEKLRAKYPEDGWNEKKARRLLLGRQEKNGGMGGLTGRLPGLFTEEVAQLNEHGYIVGKPAKHFKFPQDVSKLDFFGLQVMVREPDGMAVSYSNGIGPGNSPESPAFPDGFGEKETESNNLAIPTSSPNSPDKEYEGMIKERTDDNSSCANSGEIGVYGEKPAENEAIDNERYVSPGRGNAWGAGGELIHDTAETPLGKPKHSLEAGAERLEELRKEAIRRKMEAKKRDEALLCPDASANYRGNDQRSGEAGRFITGHAELDDAILSRYCNELKRLNQEVTSFKLADMARAAGHPIPIDSCKAWLMKMTSLNQDPNRDCGSCPVALKGDSSAAKCNPCCYVRKEDAGDVVS